MTLPPAATTPLYTASEVETRSGVPATTLRQWERRYGLPSPLRNASGYRLYSPHDLTCIEFILARQEEGVPVSRAVELAREHFASPGHPAPLPEVAALVAALLQPDHKRSGEILAGAHARLGTEEVMLGIMQPALVKIGVLWERGEITVAHEHQASAFLRSRLTGLLEAAGQGDFGPVVVAACGPGEHHELGLLMLSVVLRRRGLRLHYLGANTPLADMAVYARQVGAEALLVSINSHETLARFQAERGDLAGLEVPLYFGGTLLNMAPQLAAELGGGYLGTDAVAAATALTSRLRPGSRPDPVRGPG